MRVSERALCGAVREHSEPLDDTSFWDKIQTMLLDLHLPTSSVGCRCWRPDDPTQSCSGWSLVFDPTIPCNGYNRLHAAPCPRILPPLLFDQTGQRATDNFLHGLKTAGYVISFSGARVDSAVCGRCRWAGRGLTEGGANTSELNQWRWTHITHGMRWSLMTDFYGATACRARYWWW